MSGGIPRVDILGVPFVCLDADAALAEATSLYDSPGAGFIAHANVHTVNLAFEDDSYRRVLSRADLVLNDGKGVLLAARMLGTRFPRDLNGNFFTPLLLEHAADKGWPVFFFGAKPGVAERAAEVLRRRIPRLDVVGTRDGYHSPGEEAEIAASIRSSGAGLLLVGLGNPRQERWLDAHLDATGARLGVGVGAFFDFQAGEIRRAPAWMRSFGLEWVHRLAKEPKRMWRRYIVGNPLFLYRVARSRVRGSV